MTETIPQEFAEWMKRTGRTEKLERIRELERKVAGLKAERDAWKEAAGLYREAWMMVSLPMDEDEEGRNISLVEQADELVKEYR